MALNQNGCGSLGVQEARLEHRNSGAVLFVFSARCMPVRHCHKMCKGSGRLSPSYRSLGAHNSLLSPNLRFDGTNSVFLPSFISNQSMCTNVPNGLLLTSGPQSKDCSLAPSLVMMQRLSMVTSKTATNSREMQGLMFNRLRSGVGRAIFLVFELRAFLKVNLLPATLSCCTASIIVVVHVTAI